MFCHKCGTNNPDNGKFCRQCGTDLAITAPPREIETRPTDFYLDRKGRMRSSNPDDLWASGLKSTILGIGFLVVALVLLITNVANGHNWWWAMLFPAFSMLAGGIGNLAKSKRLEKKKLSSVEQSQPTLFAQTSAGASLPPLQTDSVKPQRSVYDTGELIAPPSIVEGTTRHLEMNAEGETMTLPKK